MIERTASESQPYCTYLVRCWKAGNVTTSARYIVETVSDSPQRWGFASLSELLRFLEKEIANFMEAGDAK